MALNREKRDKALSKELQQLQKQEVRITQAAQKAKPAGWKEMLENKIPDKVYAGLESAFCKAFSLVFKQGKAIIEKGFNKDEIHANQNIRDYAVQVKDGRKELQNVRKSTQKSDFLNLAVTTVEGIGLGALGIGIPDIVLFLGTLLKGIYETIDIPEADFQEQLAATSSVFAMDMLLLKWIQGLPVVGIIGGAAIGPTPS